MTNLSTQAQAIIDAFYRSCLGKQPTFKDDRIAVAATLRALVSNNEEWVDGTYMVKSEDIFNIATELENL